MRKPTAIMTSSTKKQNPKLPNFLKIESTRVPASVEGLNSTLAQSADELFRKFCGDVNGVDFTSMSEPCRFWSSDANDA